MGEGLEQVLAHSCRVQAVLWGTPRIPRCLCVPPTPHTPRIALACLSLTFSGLQLTDMCSMTGGSVGGFPDPSDASFLLSQYSTVFPPLYHFPLILRETSCSFHRRSNSISLRCQYLACYLLQDLCFLRKDHVQRTVFNIMTHL